MAIVGFELIASNIDQSPVASDGEGAAEGGRVPAVVVVHLDLPGNTASDPDASSSLRFEHVDNLIARFFTWKRPTACQLLEELLPAPDACRRIGFTGGDFLFESGETPPIQRPPDELAIQLLASREDFVSSSFPMYSMLTDVAPEESADLSRWAEDIEFYEGDGPGKEIGLDQCDPRDRRARRSRVLAELAVRPWALGVGLDPADESVRDWRNWHVTFSRTGAGFAHSGTEKEAFLNRHRRDDLSTVYVDLVALEMLKDRVIGHFSELTRVLASGIRHSTDLHESCLNAWKTLVTFTSEYFGRTSGLGIRDREFMEDFRRGAGLDLEKDLERAQANLTRLAEVARVELEQERSDRERNLAKAEKARIRAEQKERDEQADAEKSFNRLVGILATVVIPLAVVPPMIEWFFPFPSKGAWVTGVVAILVLGGLIAVLLYKNRIDKPEVRIAGSGGADHSNADRERKVVT